MTIFGFATAVRLPILAASITLGACDRFYAIERGRVVVAGHAGSDADRQQLFAAIAV